MSDYGSLLSRKRGFRKVSKMVGLIAILFTSSHMAFQVKTSFIFATCFILVSGLSLELERLNDSKFSDQNPNKIYGKSMSQIFDYKTKNIQISNTQYDASNTLNSNNTTEPSTALSWGAGLFSGFCIILCSACGIILTPLTKKAWYKKLLLYLVSTATSSLLGNSLFQLIPPAYGVEVDISDEENIWKSAACYLSFVAFFMIERVLKIVFEDEQEISENSTTKKYEVHGQLHFKIQITD